MGLSAGQARLLTITGRKSDCEFQSMRLSHQKIALTRQLADLSNEYQNSLDQTKLIYDFYGTGDTSTQLSYNLLMSPSALNNYMPTLITDSLGRVTLNSNLAKAARAAGIPQEGLGSLPSDTMRNNFIEGLASSGVITTDMANKILGLPYNQSIGFGGGTTVATTTQSGTLDDFCDYLEKMGDGLTIHIKTNQDMGDACRGVYLHGRKGGEDKNTIEIDSYGTDKTYDVKLSDLLQNDIILNLEAESKCASVLREEAGKLVFSTVEDILDQVGEYFASVLDLGDSYTAKALEYATSKIKDMYIPLKNSEKFEIDHDNMTWVDSTTLRTENHMGWVSHAYKRHSGGHHWNSSAININSMLKAYLTYFEDYKNGVSTLDLYGQQYLDVKRGLLAENKLVTDKKDYMYTWKTGSEVSSDDMGQAAFYDALFNQLCARGWTENDDITKNQYLQEMLQSGRLYVSRTKDDGYYYQGNYSTDSYIKEVADETLIAHAEAKYNTEKAKLNQKEEMLDLKMKNLDTEISSLTTEYDTVKNTISKNIEKSFKRYNA